MALNKKIFFNVSVLLSVLICLFANVGFVSAAEPGVSFDTAGTIDTASEITGTLDDDSQEHFYKIELEPGSIIEIEFTPPSGDGQLLKFYKPNGDQVIRVDVNGGITETVSYTLSSERETDYWFVKVIGPTGWDYAGDYTLDVSVDSQDDAGSGGDAPSSLGEAYEIQEGEHTGLLKDEDSEDMYKISLEPSSIIEMEFTPDSEDGQKLKFYKPNGDQVRNIDVNGGITETVSYTLSGERETDYWFVKVIGPAGWDYAGDYNLDISSDSQDDAGSNEDAPSSFDKSLELQAGEYSGMLADEDSKDMYRISLEAGSTIEFEFNTDAEDGQQLHLYNPNRERKASIDTKQGLTETESYTLESEEETGYWYLEVNGPKGWDSDGDYDLDISLEGEPTQEVEEEEPKPEFEVSNLRSEPASVVEGEEAKLMVDVSNTGEAAGEHTVKFNVGEENIGSDTVSLESGETKTASVTYTTKTSGTINVGAGELNDEITVEKETSLLWLWILLAAVVLIVIIALVIILSKSRKKGKK